MRPMHRAGMAAKAKAHSHIFQRKADRRLRTGWLKIPRKRGSHFSV